MPDDTVVFSTLKLAPITEAIIDFRVELPSTVDINTLEEIHDQLKDEFPIKAARTSTETEFRFEPGKDVVFTPKAPKTEGFYFKNQLGDMVVQVRLDGFTLSKLKPYRDWSSFELKFRQLWAIYSHEASPSVITRIAVRYLNRIDLPLGATLKDYLLTVPEIAPQLPQGLSDFLMRIVINDEKTSAVAIVTESSDVVRESTEQYPVILDIDAFRHVSLQVDDESIWGILQELRNFKNQVFFGSLTNSAIEGFK